MGKKLVELKFSQEELEALNEMLFSSWLPSDKSHAAKSGSMKIHNAMEESHEGKASNGTGERSTGSF